MFWLPLSLYLCSRQVLLECVPASNFWNPATLEVHSKGGAFREVFPRTPALALPPHLLWAPLSPLYVVYGIGCLSIFRNEALTKRCFYSPRTWHLDIRQILVAFDSLSSPKSLSPYTHFSKTRIPNLLGGGALHVFFGGELSLPFWTIVQTGATSTLRQWTM